MLESRL